MTRDEADALVVVLAAAYPRDWAWVDPLTRELYSAKLRELPRPQAGHAAVEALVNEEEKLPTVARIRDEYRRHHDRFSPRALPEPDLTEDDVRRNSRRIRAVAAHVARRDGHDGDVDSCPHPECDYLRTLSVPGAGQD